VVVDENRVVRYATVDIAISDNHASFDKFVNLLLNKEPYITTSPSNLYFGTKMQVGQSKTVSISLSNSGAGPLSITGYNAPDGVTVQPGTLTIAPQEKQTVQITLTPTREGAVSGNVTFNNNSAAVGPLTVPILSLTVSGSLSPSIGLAQTSIDLGQTDVGASVQKTFTVTNAGPGTLNVSDIQSDLPGLTVSDKQFSIPAGGTKDVAFTFTPQAEGAFSGTITVVSNDPTQGNIGLTLSGTAMVIPADPRADFDHSGTVDFPDFLSFVQAFGTTDTTFDLDGSGRVDFADFLIFASSFGKKVG